MIWNIESYNQPPDWPTASQWERDLNDMINGLDDGHPRFRHMRWMDAFDEQIKPNPMQALRDSFSNMSRFSLPLGTDKVEWTVWLTPDQLWNRLCTLSQIVVMKDNERAHTRRLFEAAMAREDCVLNEQGQIMLTGCTYSVWTQAL